MHLLCFWFCNDFVNCESFRVKGFHDNVRVNFFAFLLFCLTKNRLSFENLKFHHKNATKVAKAVFEIKATCNFQTN